MIDIKVLNRHSLLLFLFAFVFAGCDRSSDDSSAEETEAIGAQELQYTQRSVPLEQFVTWVVDKENKLVKDKTISDINYQLAYLPQEYLAYNELKGETFDKAKFEEVEKGYSELTYFKFRIEAKEEKGELLKHDLQSAQQYNERINYMSFKMQNDIILVQEKDTIFPGLFHFERVFEVAPYATVMFAFDKKKFDPVKGFTIIYNDHLFNKGYIKYNYRQNQTIDLPNITGV